jgi:hypothetical protein
VIGLSISIEEMIVAKVLMSSSLSWWKSVRMAMLSKHDHVRSQVAGSTHKISGPCSLLVRVVGCKVDENLNLRLGNETKGRQVENTGWEG